MIIFIKYTLFGVFLLTKSLLLDRVFVKAIATIERYRLAQTMDHYPDLQLKIESNYMDYTNKQQKVMWMELCLVQLDLQQKMKVPKEMGCMET